MQPDGPSDAPQPRQCACTGVVACTWEDRHGEHISVCVRCGGDR